MGLLSTRIKLYQQKAYLFAVTAVIIFSASCKSKRVVPYNQSPDYIKQELEKARDPATGAVESQRLYQYLLSQKQVLGANNSLNKSEIYPNTWKPVDDFFASLAIQRLVHDPSNTLVFYFCTGEGWNNADAARGAGVWKSVDGGETWSQLASTTNDTFYYCHDVAVHPVNGDVYVATRTGGLQRSKDGGLTWQQVLGAGNGSIENSTTDIEFTADDELVVCIGNFNTDGIYFSTSGDAGSWEKRMNGFPSQCRRIDLATAPSNASYMYAIPTSSLSSDSNRIHGVYKTIDKGLNWSQVSHPGGDRNLAKLQGWYDLVVKVDPNNENIVLVGGLNTFRSRDGGDTWQLLFNGDRRATSNLQYVHVDQHEVLFKDSDTVLLGNDGGIYRCNNMMADTPYFYSINDNYNVTQFYTCAMPAQIGDDRVIGGTQDNGSLGSGTDGVSGFEQLSWADGSYCNINHQDPEIFFTTTQYQRMYRFNHGAIDTISNPKLNSRNTQFINPIEMDNNPRLLYQLSEIGLWRMNDANTDTKDNWIQASRSFGAFTAIGISTQPANVAFIGRNSGGRIFRIEDVHNSDANLFPTSCDLSGQLPAQAYCNCIYVDPKDANHVIVVYSNYGVESVWESKDALSARPTWVSQEGNLPDIPVRWAVLHPQNASVCYLATEAGVMMTQKLDGVNTQWVAVNEGLANLKINMLRLRADDLTLTAASHGRGMYTGKIQPDGTVKWQERGPMNVGGRTRTLMFDPNDPTGKKLWAGSVSGGLWVARNYDSIKVTQEILPGTFAIRLGANPVENGKLMVYLTAEKAYQFNFKLYNVNGQLVEEWTADVDAGERTIPLDLSRARNGIYFLKLTDSREEVNEVWRLLVQ